MVHEDVWRRISPGSGASSANARGQESVCVQGRARRQVWLDEPEVEMRSNDGPDPVCFQDVRRGLMSSQ